MKKIIIALLLLVMIGMGIGLYMYNKPLESTASMKTEYTMQASELLLAFENNEEEANKKYLDKVIAVEGKVTKVEKAEEKTTIYLDADNPMSSIIFQLENDNDSIKKGETVKLKGICTGYLMDVVLVRAVTI